MSAREDDYNLQEAWDRVCGSFEKTTNGLDLTKTPPYTPEQVLEQIRAKQDEGDEKNAKFKVAKDVITITLACIKTLGKIAAQGTSMVFGPSDLCSNAVSYLIQAGVNYKRIFSSLAELFQRISDVLVRTKIYLRMPTDAVDIDLRKIINDELLCFVSICALSTKLMNGHKVLIALRVFSFNSDEGVGDELRKLSLLVEKEDQLRGTLGFESQKTSERNIIETKEGTKKINATVDKVLQLENQRDADNKEKKQLKEIDANLDNPSEIYKVVQSSFKRIQNKKVEGTGEWLKQDASYNAWASGEQSSFSVLCVSGDEGYGKSFLLPTIVKDIQDRFLQMTDDLTCTSLAYYFFQQESTAKGSQQVERDSLLLLKALKVLAYQIASSDVVFRKDLASAKASGVNQTRRLWDMLFSKAYKTDSTIFLLLDGVDQLENDQIKDLSMLLVEMGQVSNDWAKFNLRILLTGRDSKMEIIESHLDKKIPVIHIASKNGDDIEKFIKSRIKKMDTLDGESSQVEALRAEILTKLTKEANGDFINVDLLLNEISDKQRPGEIRDVLSKSGENRSDTIARKIEGLNQTLGDNDISDLNELLTWVMCAVRPLTLEELEAVLFVKNNEPSLRSLNDEIKDRYSALFRVVGEVDRDTRKMSPTAQVTLVSDSIEDYLRTKAEKEAAEERQSWNSTGDVLESEVRIVKRFLESVCDPKLFKKFEFEQFFERKLNGRTAKVGVDLEAAHLKIAIMCIQTICSKDSAAELAPLTKYAMDSFSAHLDKVDPSFAQPQNKTSMGPLLVKLFTDEEIIRKWWIEDRIWDRSTWLYNDDSSDVVLKWFQDSAVTKNLPEDEKKWVKSLSSKSEPDADLLENVAKFLACGWLQDDGNSVLGELFPLFCLIDGYNTKIANRKDPGVKRSTEFLSNNLEISQIKTAVIWAQKSIGLESLGYHETRNVARAFRDFGQPGEAIGYFNLASSLDSDNWLSQWGLASVYEKQKEWALAIETLEAVRAEIESGEANAGDPMTELPAMMGDIALWNKKAGNFDKALEIYEALLAKKPEDYDCAFEIISILRKKGDFARLLEFFKTLKLSKDESTGLDRRTQLFHTHSWKREYHEDLVAVGSNPQNFDVVKDHYKMAIEAAQLKLEEAKERNDRLGEAEMQGTVAMLLHYSAHFFYNHDINREQKQHAISLWEAILQMEDLEAYNFTFWYAKRLVTAEVSAVYFQEARLAGKDSEAAAEYIKKLEQLSVTPKDEDMNQWSLQTYPKQILAKWYAITGQESKVKDVLRGLVKTSLDLLSDDDPTNDWQAYTGLAMHFMYAGQDDDALASWSLIPPDDLVSKESVATASRSGEAGDETTASDSITRSGSTEAQQPDLPLEAAKELEGPMSYVCDGRCGQCFKYANDIYVCRDCSDVQFDERCLKALRAGTLERHVCSKDHEMLHVPKYDELELKRIGKGNVKVGSTVMKVDDWISGIKQQWGIAI